MRIMDNRYLVLLSLALLVMGNTTTSIAATRTHHACPTSQRALNDYEPTQFLPSNNLLRTQGQPDLYCGEKIIIYGKVRDNQCQPVADAKVYLWQANCNGKYPYTPLKNTAKKEFIETKHNSTFTGNGTATTNNKGEFVFITTYPGAVNHQAPSVNIRIEHYLQGTIQTQFALHGKHVINPQDHEELRYVIDAIGEDNTGIYELNIVLPSKSNNIK